MSFAKSSVLLKGKDTFLEPPRSYESDDAVELPESRPPPKAGAFCLEAK